ncbi:MAG: hydrolase TatD, partial [Tenericutes bacterium HGW-Tenericutes-6]
MIDTHAHLNMDDFNDDMDQVIKRAKENGLSHIIVIGMDHKSSLRAIELAETYDMVYATVGLHPGYVDEGDLDFIKPLLKHPKVLGIGECGLDFYWR